MLSHLVLRDIIATHISCRICDGCYLILGDRFTNEFKIFEILVDSGEANLTVQATKGGFVTIVLFILLHH